MAQKKLFFKSFQNYKNNIKETWATISVIIRKTPSQVNVHEKLEIDGVITEYKNAIVNNLNQYFANVDEETASKTPIPDTVTYKDYLSKLIHSRFKFEVITNIDAARIVKHLTPKKFNTIMLKHMKNELIIPIPLLINQTGSTGIFPDNLKIAKVIPLYKKGDPCIACNYRPISHLPSISKNFESALCEQ